MTRAPRMPHHRHLDRRARHHITPTGWMWVCVIGFWAVVLTCLRFA